VDPYETRMGAAYESCRCVDIILKVEKHAKDERDPATPEADSYPALPLPHASTAEWFASNASRLQASRATSYSPWQPCAATRVTQVTRAMK
jgi:hypothetical protein